MVSSSSSVQTCSVYAPDGVCLEYEVEGEGATVVFLHGGLAGRSTFSDQRAALQPYYRLVLPSLRGHDGTEPTFGADYGIDTTEVADLDAVLEAAGVGQFSLIGHSTGGAIALAYALRSPERVERLVLIEPTLFALLPDLTRRDIFHRINEIVVRGRTMGPDAGLAATLEYLGGDAWANLHDERKSRRIAALSPMGPLILKHWESLMHYEVTVADLKATRCPVLAVYGSKSYPFEAEILEKLLAERPDFEHLWVEGAAHNVHSDRPVPVNERLLEFLGCR